jgi:hypothetical protein
LQFHRTPAGQTLFSFINTIPGRRSLKQITLPPTLGFAILGQKQYPSALVHYLASVRAEVFQFSFLSLSSSSVFQLGSGSGRNNFKFPNIAKPYR